MVTGVVPWLRYIVVTDRLIETLSDEEIEGVFGHEVGHVKHHHMFFYILFMMTSLMVLGGLGYLGVSLVAQPEAQAWLQENVPFLHALVNGLKLYALLPILFMFAIYMFVVFGYLSRRCERQADLYGCRTTKPDVFIDALEKVALHNGIPREKPGWLWSWQHGTIAQRVAFLQDMKEDPAIEPRFQRRLFALKWGIVLVMAACSAGVLAGMRHLLGADEMWRFINQL
jgi:STE24 endopeptidase